MLRSGTVPVAGLYSGQQRFEFIDSLRGLSCLLVVYMHAAQWTLTNLPEMPSPDATWLRWSITFIDPGKVGVLIFFVISGYVVPHSLQRPQPRVARRFVINRAFRILPAFWASIGIAVLVMAALADRKVSMAAILGNSVLAPQLFSTGWILDVYWSLQVELVFYVLCLFLALAGQINRPLLPVHLSAGLLLVALLGAIARDWLKVPVPVGLALFLSLMFWGFAARMVRDNRDRRTRRGLRLLTSMLIALLPVICFIAYHNVPSMYGTWHAYALSYLAAVLIFLWLGVVRSTVWRLFTWIGRISYSVYLMHVPSIVIIGSLLPLASPGLLLAISIIFVFTSMSVVVACVSFRWIEAPTMNLDRLGTAASRIALFYATPVTRRSCCYAMGFP